VEKAIKSSNVNMDDQEAIKKIYIALTKQERHVVHDIPNVHWIGKTFDHTPVVAAIASLSAMQKEVLTARADAVALIRSKSALPDNTVLNDVSNSPIASTVKGIALTQAIAYYFDNINEKDINSKLNKKGKNVALTASAINGVMAIPTNNGGDFLGLNPNSPSAQRYNASHNITVNVHSADPKAVVDAVSQYVKTNGKVPASWGTGGRR
jgi:hypothetical protein